MADISKINVDGTQYDISDDVARARNLPAGGTTGQILKKNSNTAYDASWANEYSYTLPKASASTLGGIRVGTNLSISSDGVLSATDTKYTASTESIGSASAGTAIAADDITAWNAGSAPTLGTAIAADDITSWSAGSVPTLGTAIPADDITAWNAGTLPAATVDGENLTLTFGSLPSLSYTAKSIPNVTSVGSVPTLQYTARSIPNVT